ncbi:MAG: acyltransferase family protein, partial [Prevotella sp.]|nr:acyltransferase family protein [Prevotella sp.]
MKFVVINFLRGFAIFSIVLMHCLQGYLDGILCKAASFGGAGVHVFILCSGFGLYLSYLNKPLGYWEFLRKRFGKVYMPYVVVIGFYVLWYLVTSVEIEWNAVVSHLFLYKMFNNE